MFLHVQVKQLYLHDSDSEVTPGTHRVDVQGGGGALDGVHGGLTAPQRSLQRVVGGVLCSFAGRVLQREVGVSDPARLRKHQKNCSVGKRSKNFFLY